MEGVTLSSPPEGEFSPRLNWFCTFTRGLAFFFLGCFGGVLGGGGLFPTKGWDCLPRGVLL